MLGQFDPRFTEYMNEVMALYRQVFQTENQWTLLINGTARAGIEACLTSFIVPGDKVLVPIFGRFGHLLTEIARRCGGEVVTPGKGRAISASGTSLHCLPMTMPSSPS